MTEIKDLKQDMRVSVKYIASTVLRTSIFIILLIWIGVSNQIENTDEVESSVNIGLVFTIIIYVCTEFIILLIIGSEIELLQEPPKEEIEETEETK